MRDALKSPLEGPYPGLAAYQTDSPAAAFSRVAQLGILGQFAVGTQAQAADIQEDAASLRVPQGPTDGSRGIGESGALAIANDYLHDHVPGALESASSDPEAGIRAAREAADDDPGQWSTLALARVSLSSRSAAEMAMAAAVVASYALDPRLEQAISGAGLTRLWESAPQSYEALQRASRSRNKIASQIAAARLGAAVAVVDESAVSALTGRPQVGDSVAVHGTWARIAESSWYRPGDATHNHIKHTCTPGLYADDDYFRWSGAYSDVERAQASADLRGWLSLREIALDTAYGHSHGGNVLLGTELSEPGQLLVLLHTPVLPRSDDDWARVRGTWERVLVMRSRADPVVLADGLRTGSTGQPDRNNLDFRLIRPHITDRRGWFTHGFFVQERTWDRYRLSNEVAYERGLPSRRRLEGQASSSLLS